MARPTEELALAWQLVNEHPYQHFSAILRGITIAVRRQVAMDPMVSPRAVLLDALSALAPAIRHHFPNAVEPICRTAEAIVPLLP